MNIKGETHVGFPSAAFLPCVGMTCHGVMALLSCDIQRDKYIYDILIRIGLLVINFYNNIFICNFCSSSGDAEMKDMGYWSLT